jgi:hypothetical protein
MSMETTQNSVVLSHAHQPQMAVKAVISFRACLDTECCSTTYLSAFVGVDFVRNFELVVSLGAVNSNPCRA